MNALKRFKYTNPKKELNLSRSKNVPDKYFENLYPKILTEDAIKYLLNRILRHRSNNKSKIKRIGKKFVKNHPEIFGNTMEEIEENERTDDEDDFKGVVFVTPPTIHIDKDLPKDSENTSEKEEENVIKNKEENDSENKDDAIGNLKEEIIEEVIDELREDTPPHQETHHNLNKEILDLIDKKFNDFKRDSEKKYNDMLDGYIELRNSIKEKKHIDNTGITNRIDNIEGKLEMLHGKQMDDVSKSEKRNKFVKPKTKEDYLKRIIKNNFI